MVDRLTYLSISSQLLLEAARNKGLRTQVISPDLNLFEISSNTKTLTFRNTDFGVNTSFALKMADDKKCSDILLERAGFPVPKSVYIAFDDADDISSVVAGLRFPLVVKPVDGAHGEGVVTNITDLKKLTTVAQATLKKSRRIIVQEHVAGHEFRVLVLLGESFLAIRRDPAHVMGDGKHTIEQLIEIENQNPLRGLGYEKPLTLITNFEQIVDFLISKGQSLKTIPDAGEHVPLIGVSNLGQGGTASNVTHLVSDQVKDMCRKIAQTFGFGFLGVDMIASDLETTSCDEVRIIEINATPGIGGHVQLLDFDSAAYVIDRLFFS